MSAIRPRYWIATGVVLTLTLLQANWLHSRLQLNGQSLSSEALFAKLAEYEHRYKSFAKLPMPSIDTIKTRVDVYPERREMRIQGQLLLVNRESRAIEQLLISEHWRKPLDSIQLHRQAELSYDQAQGQRLYRLASPLQPGDSLTLSFTLNIQQNGYVALSLHKVITEKFSYLRAIPYFPGIGYKAIRELDDHDLRRRYQLPVRSDIGKVQRLADRDPAGDVYDWAKMDTLMSTPSGYQGFTQGRLTDSYRAQGRVYRRFQTRGPIRNVQAFVSAPVELAKRQVGPVRLQVAYHPEHGANVPMTLDAMSHTLDFLSRHIGPYPGETLTLIEAPDLGFTGYALPQLMLIASKVGFRVRQDDEQPFSQSYRRAVHETAHQWFGHLLGNGIEQDSAFMIESMAKYVELVMLERHRGKPAMENLVDYERRRYLNAEAHNRQATVSLIGAESPHDSYSRATLVFARLRAELSDAPILAALAELEQKHRYPKAPASSLDFVNALIQQAPARRELIETLLLKPVPVTEWLTESATTQY